MRIAFVTGGDPLGNPAGRPLGGRGRAPVLAFAVALGLVLAGGVVADRDAARSHQGIALALKENQALRARQETLRERAVALEERLGASRERDRPLASEQNAAR